MSTNVVWHHGAVEPDQRATVTGGRGATVLLTGLSGSGKSTIAVQVEKQLIHSGRAGYVLDGDNLRHGINSDLGFSDDDRFENVRRVGEIARLMNDAGLVVLIPVIAPFAASREAMRIAHANAALRFLEVFVDTPLEVCESRDPKGLYARARAGEITGMTGIDSPYEPPESPDLLVETTKMSLNESTQKVLELLGSPEG